MPQDGVPGFSCLQPVPASPVLESSGAEACQSHAALCKGQPRHTPCLRPKWVTEILPAVEGSDEVYLQGIGSHPPAGEGAQSTCLKLQFLGILGGSREEGYQITYTF